MVYEIYFNKLVNSIVKNIYYNNHLKSFVPRQGYLSRNKSKNLMLGSQTERKPKKKR